MRNLEIGMQSQDSENAQRNLEIPRLRRTYAFTSCPLRMQNENLEDNSENSQHGNSQATAQRKSRSAISGWEEPIGSGSYGKQGGVAGRSELNLL